MKKILIIAGSVLAVVAVALVLIFTLVKTDSGLTDNPALTDAVIGNGGITVQKGDYLYFVNGNTTASSISAGDNDFGDIEYGAIYRTKLTNNAIAYDQDGFLTNIDVVVPKLVGYENGSFYVYGNYIYYSTPNNNKDHEGNSLTSLTDFYRININGTDNQKIYTSTAEDLTPDDWTIYVVGDTHYFVVKDDTNIIVAKTSDKNVGDTSTVASDVTSVAFLNYDNFYNNNREEENYYNNYIYYTRSVNDNDNLSVTGNFLARVKLGTSTEEIVYSAGENTYTLIGIANHNLYYTKSNSSMLQTDLVFKNAISQTGIINSYTSDIQLTYTSYADIYIVNDDTTTGNYLIAYQDDALYLISAGQLPKLVLDKAISILNVYNDTVIYYDSDSSSLYRINAMAITPTETSLPLDDKTMQTDNSNLVDYDGTTVYIYVGYTSADTSESNNYLNRINQNAETIKTEFIGKMLDSHLPTQPDNSEVTDPEEYELWIK